MTRMTRAISRSTRGLRGKERKLDKELRRPRWGLIALFSIHLPLQAADSIDVGAFVADTTGTAPYTQTISHNLGEVPDALLIWTTHQSNH